MDAKELRKLYRAELEEKLKLAGGKTRKRTFKRMVQVVSEYRGAELETPDEHVLVWSDLHIGHANIIDYAERPFLSRDDMDAHLWDAWRRTVTEDHVLVVVGDVALSDAVCDATWERIGAMPRCHSHLVIGNHDVSGPGEVRTQGFDDVWSVMMSAGDPPLLWTHYPLEEVPEGHVNIHGHQHEMPPKSPQHINVSVEQLEYEPVSLARLRALACALNTEEQLPGGTTIERIAHIEGREKNLRSRPDPST